MHKQGALREFGHYAAMNILGMIGISCYILADTYFVAQGLGSLGLAALNIAIPAYNLMNGIGLMLGVGAATQYTIARAQNDRRQADSVFTHAAALGLLLGLLFLLGGLCFAKPLAGLLGADAQTLGMTTTYLRMLWCFGPFFVMNNVLLAFTRNDGAPTVAMCGMIAGSLFNIVFDYIFIFPCGLGMFGAALATGFSPFVSILVLLTHLRRPSRGFHLVKTPLRVSRVPSLCAPGLSSLIGEIASGVVLLLFNLVLLRLSGNTGVALTAWWPILLWWESLSLPDCAPAYSRWSAAARVSVTGNSCGGCSAGASAPRSGLQPCCACRFSSARSR